MSEIEVLTFSLVHQFNISDLFPEVPAGRGMTQHIVQLNASRSIFCPTRTLVKVLRYTHDFERPLQLHL